MSDIKIIVGAGNTSQIGWASLKHSQLDITNIWSWQNLFWHSTVDAILCEHVIEHLTEAEARAAVSNFYHYLRRGGYARIAVPDGLHPQSAYQQWVAPNSKGEQFLNLFRESDEPPHKTLWNYRTLTSMLSGVGFNVRLLEWFDGRGVFHQSQWRPEDGDIWRTFSSAYTKWFLNPLVGCSYSSLIVDAGKF